jgi:hypothetical protein
LDVCADKTRSGGTALIAAIEPNAVRLSWRYIPVVIATTCIMFGWALLINNLGRRNYPQYWWAAGRTFVQEEPTPREDEEMGVASGAGDGQGGVKGSERAGRAGRFEASPTSPTQQ